MQTKSKDLDFELNLLPILSVLSICICFLLTTAVWNRLGTIDINQAIGDVIPKSVIDSGKVPDSVFLKVKASGDFVLQWKKGEDSSLKEEKIIHMDKSNAKNVTLFWTKLKGEITNMVKQSKVSSVIVMPEIGTNYGETIKLLDQLKALSLNIGLAPAIKGVH